MTRPHQAALEDSEPFRGSPVWTLLPQLERVDTAFCLRDGEVLIHAPGFESRTTAITGCMYVRGRPRAILLEYKPLESRNRLREVRRRLTSLGVEVDPEPIEYDRFDPGLFESHLLLRLRQTAARAVVVDISSMSKLAIILVLQVCQRMDVSTRLFYAEARSYAPSQRVFLQASNAKRIHRPTLQVYTGVHGVVRVDSLGSVSMQGQPTAALVFMSFNDALTQVLLNSVYPARLLLINGRPPRERWREMATAWIHDQVRREWEEDNPTYPSEMGVGSLPKRAASTLDYREAFILLMNLYWELSHTHRILLAPAGSKMQSVAGYLMKALHPDIHIEYPAPEGFAFGYSKGVGPRWLLDVGRLSRWLGQIGEAERRHHLAISPDE